MAPPISSSANNRVGARWQTTSIFIYVTPLRAGPDITKTKSKYKRWGFLLKCPIMFKFSGAEKGCTVSFSSRMTLTPLMLGTHLNGVGFRTCNLDKNHSKYKRIESFWGNTNKDYVLVLIWLTKYEDWIKFIYSCFFGSNFLRFESNKHQIYNLTNYLISHHYLSRQINSLSVLYFVAGA